MTDENLAQKLRYDIETIQNKVDTMQRSDEKRILIDRADSLDQRVIAIIEIGKKSRLYGII